MNKNQVSMGTELPPLPRVLKKREASVTARVMKAMLDNPNIASCAVELKHVRGNRMSASKFKPHQRRALLECTSAFKHKLSDMGRILQPFDGFIFKKAEAYLVIYFDLRGQCECYAIPINSVPECSITINMARAIGISIHL